MGFRAHRGRRLASEPVVRKTSQSEEGLDELMIAGLRTFPASMRAAW